VLILSLWSPDSVFRSRWASKLGDPYYEYWRLEVDIKVKDVAG